MKYSTQIKPISYLKAHAAEILDNIADSPPLIITQNGEAKAVLQSVYEYEKTQETLALLQILMLGEREFSEGKFSDARTFLEDFKNSKMKSA